MLGGNTYTSLSPNTETVDCSDIDPESCLSKWKDTIPSPTMQEPVILGAILATLAILALSVSVATLYLYSGWRRKQVQGKATRRSSYVDEHNYTEGGYEDKLQHKPTVPTLLPSDQDVFAPDSTSSDEDDEDGSPLIAVNQEN